MRKVDLMELTFSCLKKSATFYWHLFSRILVYAFAFILLLFTRLSYLKVFNLPKSYCIRCIFFLCNMHLPNFYLIVKADLCLYQYHNL